MAKKYNKLTRPEQFRLTVAVQQYGDTPNHKTFTTYDAAAEFFGNQLGMTLTAKNVLGACKTVGKQAIIAPINGHAGGAGIASAWGKLDGALSRIALLEARVSELETLVG